jgi:hypothetical protein
MGYIVRPPPHAPRTKKQAEGGPTGRAQAEHSWVIPRTPQQPKKGGGGHALYLAQTAPCGGKQVLVISRRSNLVGAERGDGR